MTAVQPPSFRSSCSKRRCPARRPPRRGCSSRKCPLRNSSDGGPGVFHHLVGLPRGFSRRTLVAHSRRDSCDVCREHHGQMGDALRAPIGSIGLTERARIPWVWACGRCSPDNARARDGSGNCGAKPLPEFVAVSSNIRELGARRLRNPRARRGLGTSIEPRSPSSPRTILERCAITPSATPPSTRPRERWRAKHS